MRIQQLLASVLLCVFILFNGLNAFAHTSHVAEKNEQISLSVDNDVDTHCALCDLIHNTKLTLPVNNKTGEIVTFDFKQVEIKTVEASKIYFSSTSSRAPPYFL